MHITGAIHGAHDAHTIYFLLAAYVEAVGHANAGGVPPHVTRLPVSGVEDVTARLHALAAASTAHDTAPAQREHAVVAEALAVFRSAAVRLKSLGADGTGLAAREEPAIA